MIYIVNVCSINVMWIYYIGNVVIEYSTILNNWIVILSVYEYMYVYSAKLSSV